MMEDNDETKVNLVDNLTDAEPIDEAAEALNAEDYKYIAFISYRHIQPDAKIAERIHQIIETFRLPKEFYVDGKRPEFRVFRDREELTATDLSDSIETALRSSKYLIVVISKRTAQSPWCLREIETFKRLHGADRIIPVLVEGEPQESFPEPLLNLKRQRIDEEGREQDEAYEILAADLRPAEVQAPGFDGYEQIESEQPDKLAALTRKSLDLLKTEKYRIMAAILGVSYGDLKQRDKERRTRSILALTALAAALLLVFGLFMLNAYQKENTLRRKTVEQNALMIMTQAQDLLTQGDKIKALILADRAIGQVDAQMSAYPKLRLQHTGLLNGSVYVPGAAVRTTINTDNRFTNLAISPDSQYLVAGLGNQDLGVWDLENGALLHRLTGHEEQVKVVNYDPQGRYFVSGGFDDKLILWDAKTFQAAKTFHGVGNVLLGRFSKDGSYLYVVFQSSGKDAQLIIQSFDTDTFSPAFPELELPGTVEMVDFSPDGTQCLAIDIQRSDGRTLKVYDLTHGGAVSVNGPTFMSTDFLTNQEKEYQHPFKFARFSADGKAIFAAAGSSFYRLALPSGRITHQTTDQSSIIDEDNMLIQSEDGKLLYVTEGTSLGVYNSADFTKVSELSFNTEYIKRFTLSRAGDVGAITDDGNLGLAKGELIVSSDFMYGEGKPEYINFSPDNQYLAILSMTDRQIKIANTTSSNIDQTIPGQIISVSPDLSKTLYYSHNGFFLTDNHTLAITPVDEEVLEPLGYYLFKDTIQSLAISNEGEYLVQRKFYDDDDNGYPDRSTLALRSLSSGETLLEIDDASYNTEPLFSKDSQTLYLAYNDGRMTSWPLPEGEAKGNFAIEGGVVSSLLESADGKLLAVYYMEGNSRVYDLGSGAEVQKFPFKVLYLSHDSSGLAAKGVYNNIAFDWHEAIGTESRPLSDLVDRYGMGFDDIEYYHPQLDLLLTIKNGEGRDSPRAAFLVDFESGEVVFTSQFKIPNFDYVQGYLTPAGDRLIMDGFFYTSQQDVNDDAFEAELEVSQGAMVYPLLGYDALLKEKDQVISGRELSAVELRSLGIEAP